MSWVHIVSHPYRAQLKPPHNPLPLLKRQTHPALSEHAPYLAPNPAKKVEKLFSSVANRKEQGEGGDSKLLPISSPSTGPQERGSLIRRVGSSHRGWAVQDRLG